jgi:hypothetical protein
MYKSQALTYGDFCKHSEAELLDIISYTRPLCSSLSAGKNSWLTRQHDRKGMEEYKDAEFIKNNPEVISPKTDSKHEDSQKDNSKD